MCVLVLICRHLPIDLRKHKDYANQKIVLATNMSTSSCYHITEH